jgi:hypothetical protein
MLFSGGKERRGKLAEKDGQAEAKFQGLVQAEEGPHPGELQASPLAGRRGRGTSRYLHFSSQGKPEESIFFFFLK